VLMNSSFPSLLEMKEVYQGDNEGVEKLCFIKKKKTWKTHSLDMAKNT
jgi:hypothetical protein